MFDGQNNCNAYFRGPILGPDDKYHIIWCWRDSPDCSTNHGLYYAYSDDLMHWNNINGYQKDIPILPSNNEYLVDDIPVEGGLLNGGFILGFDDVKNPLIAYHKNDEKDKTNIYVASMVNHINEKRWIFNKLTNWNWKWEFSGTGSIVNELILLSVRKEESIINCTFKMINTPSQIITYNIDTMESHTLEYLEYPEVLSKKQIKDSQLVYIIVDQNYSQEKIKYIIRYETLDKNRDNQAEVVIRPSVLYLYQLSK